MLLRRRFLLSIIGTNVRIVSQFPKNRWSNSIWASGGFRRDHGHRSRMYISRTSCRMGIYFFRLEATGPFGLRGRTFFRLLHCCHRSHRWINRLVQGVGHPFATAIGAVKTELLIVAKPPICPAAFATGFHFDGIGV